MQGKKGEGARRDGRGDDERCACALGKRLKKAKE
jgi:hypothetical protein